MAKLSMVGCLVVMGLLTGCATQSAPIEPKVDSQGQLLQELTRRVVGLEQEQNALKAQVATLAEYARLPTGVAVVPVTRTGAVASAVAAGGEFDAALNLYRAGDVAQAIALFEQFLNTTQLNDARVPLAQYWLGDAYYTQRNFEMANRLLATSLKNNPNSEKAPMALAKLIESLRALGRTADAEALAQYGVQAIQ